jgi:hypothetical protein
MGPCISRLVVGEDLPIWDRKSVQVAEVVDLDIALEVNIPSCVHTHDSTGVKGILKGSAMKSLSQVSFLFNNLYIFCFSLNIDCWV